MLVGGSLCNTLNLLINVCVWYKEEFLELLDGGERHAFFQLWEEHVPGSMRTSNGLCQHLECNISVYFAIFPIRTGVGKRYSKMESLYYPTIAIFKSSD